MRLHFQSSCQVPVLRGVAALLGFSLIAAAGWGQKPPAQSPFATRGGPSPAAAAIPAPPADAVLEFTGIMKIGPSTMVCITTIADKRSRWIKVGEHSDGIIVPEQETPTASVIVRHQGREVTLPFKQPTFDPASAVPLQLTALSADPAPMAGVALKVAVTNEEKEAEARMLVSDLLEIGMIQRQAYQEAKAKELDEKRAQGQAAPAPPTPQR